MAGMTENDRSARNRKFEDLKQRAVHMFPLWRDLAWHILPTRPRFLTSDSTSRVRWGGQILDGTATRDLRVATSGLLGHMANPASQWFEFDLVRRSLVTDKAVREWVDKSRDIALAVFDHTNIYGFVGEVLQDELWAGTGGGIILEHHEKILHAETFPIGSYYIGRDMWGQVNQVARSYTMTAAQLVEKYGEGVVSSATRNAYRQASSRQRPVEVRHLIEPNPDFVEGRLGVEGKRFRETYWENAGSTGGDYPPETEADGLTGGANGDKLAEGGYDTFPCVVATWERNADEVWGSSCPGIDCLSDIKQLQVEMRAYTNAVNKLVNPPTVSAASAENKPLSHMAGARNIDPSMEGPGTGTRELYQVRLPIQHVQQQMQDLRKSIGDTFMVPLFLKLLFDERAQRATAFETNALLREQATVLGPIQERQADELLDKVIGRSMDVMIRRSIPYWKIGEDGLLPRPPDALTGEDWTVKYTSEVANSQKMPQIQAMERHMQMLGGLLQINPEVVDTTDLDEVMQLHAEFMGLSPSITRSDEQIVAVRQARAAQRAAAQRAQMVPGLAKAAKDLGETQRGGDTMLEDVLASAGGSQGG